MDMSKSIYLTTAIDYVNGHPHLGHAYEKILTDAIARFAHSCGNPVFFLTGVDEHGQKVQQTAEKRALSPLAYCDELAVVWSQFIEKLGICNNDYVRTTQPRHQKVVSAILNKLYKEGHFYKESYRGFYSAKEETFLTEKDRLPDGSFDPMYGEVTELIEDNYYFKLGEHQQWLIEYIESHPDFIYPESRKNEVLGFLKKEKLEDLCITRPVSRLSWGIPLPFDSEFVTYVWFDALINYMSIAAAHGDLQILKLLDLTPEDFPENGQEQMEIWPPDFQVIGKDIVKFHAVYWPIMLKAIGAPFPKRLIVHGWWQKNNQKMSKSTGNTVDPIAVINEWGLDAFRYYVLRELEVGPDGNWTDSGFETRYQVELANGLGNLVNRSLSMLNRYRDGIVPAKNDELKNETEIIVQNTFKSYQDIKIQGALIKIWELIYRANQYVDQTAPFKLAKQPEQAQRLDEVLYNLVEICRILAVILWPIIPETAEKIYSQLGINTQPDLWSESFWGKLTPGHKVNKPMPLFPRRDLNKK